VDGAARPRRCAGKEDVLRCISFPCNTLSRVFVCGYGRWSAVNGRRTLAEASAVRGGGARPRYSPRLPPPHPQKWRPSMPDRAIERVPVLIVGAGYAGLSAAAMLAWRGIRPVVVERHP